MFRRACELGSIALSNPSSGLLLDLSGLAHFAASGANDLLKVHNILANTVREDPKGLPWIKRGDGYKLALEVQLLGQPLSTFNEDVMEAIAFSLKNSKVWTHLHLVASSIEVAGIQAALPTRITLSLEHSDEIPSSVRKPPSKLGQKVPYQDLKPPYPISDVDLEGIHLSIEIRQTAMLATPKREKLVRLDSAVEPTPNIDFVPKRANFDSALPTACHFHVSNGSGSGMEYPNAAAPEIPTRCQPCSECRANEESDALNHHSRLTQSAVEIVGTALALSAYGLKQRVPALMKVCKHDFVPLSKLAPALWRPGYFPAVAQNTIFEPTIAHAIRAISQRCESTVGPDTRSDYVSYRAISSKLWQACRDVPFQATITARSRSLFELGSDHRDALETEHRAELFEKAGHEQTAGRRDQTGSDEPDSQPQTWKESDGSNIERRYQSQEVNERTLRQTRQSSPSRSLSSPLPDNLLFIEDEEEIYEMLDSFLAQEPLADDTSRYYCTNGDSLVFDRGGTIHVEVEDTEMLQI